jgi:hypothetical protein
VPYQLLVELYNEAGEKVKTLYNGYAGQLPQTLVLSADVLQEGGVPVALALAGQAGGGLSWDGSNDGSQLVSSGVYYFKASYKDPFGQETTLIKAVTVLSGQLQQSLNLYNSAGELVQSLDLAAAGKKVVGFQLGKKSLAESASANGAAGDAIQVTVDYADGSTGSLWWDGRSAGGQAVAGGVYTMALVAGGVGGTKVQTDSVTVVKAAPPALSVEPKLGPNPAPAENPTGGPLAMMLSYPAPELSGAKATLYDGSGAKVSEAYDPSNSGYIKVGYEHCAGGIYLVVLDARRADGTRYRRILKAAILR